MIYRLIGSLPVAICGKKLVGMAGTRRTEEEFDVVIVGGGTGGISCASTAASLGLKVALINYVDPSPKGTQWGIGGTCLNVGCVPKFLFHAAGAILDEQSANGFFGMVQQNPVFEWPVLVANVDRYIKAKAAQLKMRLVKQQVTLFNSWGAFNEEGSVSLMDEQRRPKQTVRGKYYVIATGSRPLLQIPGCTGAEHAITSDDVFKLKKMPRTALVVGGGFVGTELASFFQALGVQVTLITHQPILRGRLV